LACAAAGFYVVLEDVMPANLRRAEEDYAYASRRGAFGAMELASTVEDAVREADITIDFVPDELESKLEIFSMIDRMAPPKTILCTPSYALSITDLASCVYRPDRCVAVRGDLVAAGSDSDSDSDSTVRLLHPAAASPATLTAVEGFLRTLGLKVQVEGDPHVPVLMKNAGRAVV
jgi:3-hydroxybutyryl-CoA dehydrogenase